MQNKGKPIYDPFAGSEQEVSVGFRPDERRTYEVHRPCGHCNGTGRSKKFSSGKSIQTEKGPATLITTNNSVASKHDPSCSQCLLGKHTRDKHATAQGVVDAWGQTIEVFAFELTDAELAHLSPEKKLGALCEIDQHNKSRVQARLLCEEEEKAARGEVILVVRHLA